MLTSEAPSGIITAEAAARAWRRDPRIASKRLARLARSGWLRRLSRGTYQVAPLEATTSSQAPYEDAWVLASAVFAPCYIGGWSAAEHWGLTEQIFRDTFVVTAANVRTTHTRVGGLEFRLARVAPERAVGDARVWRRTSRVACSSPERLLVDAGNSPAWVGGVRHLVEILDRYSDRSSHDFDALDLALEQYGRGAGAKRLGYLAERRMVTVESETARECLRRIREITHARRTTGVVKLDPNLRRGEAMDTAWGLWINTDVIHHEHS